MRIISPKRLLESVAPTVRNGSIFNASSLDLQFARTKTLDPRITFTRASSGTYVGSDGLIKTATTNLLTFSEDQSNAAWLKVGATISSNSVAAPTGSITADTLVEDTSTGTHRSVASTTILSSTIYSVSIFAKAAGRTHLRLNAGSGLAGEVIANLSNGTVASSSGATNPVVQAVGDGWYRISFTTAASTSTTGQVTAQLVQGTSTTSYTGDGTSGIYLWGAQLEQSSTVGEYIPTTSTINSAPRFDHNPTTGESLGLLVEEQRTNSLANNTMVGAAAGAPGTPPTGWTVTADANGISREIVGTGTEDGITYIDIKYSGTTTTSGQLSILPSTVTAITAASGQSWTASAYVKLQAGSLSGLTNTLLSVNGRSSVGGGLESVNTTFIPSSSALRLQRQVASITLANASTARVSMTAFAANYASGVTIDATLRIGLPQLEQGAFATSAIPTTGTAATRSADVASITGANFGVSRTNSIRNNTMVGAVAGTPGTLPTNWFTYASSGTGVTRSVVGTGFENGVSYVDLRFAGTPSATGNWSVIFEPGGSVLAATGQTWTGSFWIALVGGSAANTNTPSIFFDETNGATFVTGANYNTTLTSTFTRVSQSRTLSGGASITSVNVGFRFNVTAGAAIDITLRVGLPQLELGSTATAPIPTTNAAVTVFESSWYNQTEGTVFADAKEYPFASSASRAFYAIESSTTPNSDFIKQWIWSGNTSGLLNSIYTSLSGPVAAEFTQSLANEQKIVALTYKINDFARSYKGAAAVSDASGNLPNTIDRLGIGNSNQSQYLSGHIRRLTYFPIRLPNATLQQITR